MTSSENPNEELFLGTIKAPISFWVVAPSREAVHKVLRHVEIKDALEHLATDPIDWEGVKYEVLGEEEHQVYDEHAELRVLRTLELQFERPGDTDLGVAYEMLPGHSVYWNTAYYLAMTQQRKQGTLQPLYVHEDHDACCIYLGQELVEHREYDLYLCTTLDPDAPTLIARYGDYTHRYIQSPAFVNEFRHGVFDTAKVRAEELGLLTPKPQKETTNGL